MSLGSVAERDFYSFLNPAPPTLTIPSLSATRPLWSLDRSSSASLQTRLAGPVWGEGRKHYRGLQGPSRQHGFQFLWGAAAGIPGARFLATPHPEPAPDGILDLSASGPRPLR